MKKKIINVIAWLILIPLLFAGCSINKKQIEALAKCDYSVESMQDVQFAGKGIESYIRNNEVNMAAVPGLAVAMLRKDLPLEAKVNMKVKNPSATKTAINSFKYLIEIQGKPLFEGTVNENIHLKTGESMVVPLSFKVNLFDNAKEHGLEKMLNDAFTREGEGFLVLKIKPSMKIGNSNIYYPGYITVDRNLAKSIGKLLK